MCGQTQWLFGAAIHSGFLVQRCEASVRRASGCKAVFRALENEPERAVNALTFSMMRVNPE
jgi:hypothetical protein